MKKLIFILFVLVLTSCDTRIVTTSTSPRVNHYIVYEIHRRLIDARLDTVYCFYYLSTDGTVSFYESYITIVDSIGKFKIGEPVYLNPSKTKK